ncbi:MAG: DUF99 family protein [Candidatus Aenigmarchaeota archaeon]|nr:DUF99 family protein [Candidatus Aenigmarchaeota archaeon]
MKNVRVIGIDDSPFSRRQRECLLVGVVCRRDVVEGVLSSWISVDGTDATDRIVGMVRYSRFAPQARCVMLNSIMVGGFNVVDIVRVGDELRVPVIAVTRKRPSRGAVEKALRKHFGDWRERMRLVRRAGRVHKHKKVYMQIAGIEPEGAKEIMDTYGIEPLRLANMIAGGVSTGESRGRL